MIVLRLHSKWLKKEFKWGVLSLVSIFYLQLQIFLELHYDLQILTIRYEYLYVRK